MPYEDKKAAPQRRPHAVTLDERSHLTVTGVDEVVRFDDTEVSMRTSRGMLTVHGEGLRVGRLAIDTGSWPSTARLMRSTTRRRRRPAAASGRACSADEPAPARPARAGGVGAGARRGARAAVRCAARAAPPCAPGLSPRGARRRVLPGGGADGVRLRHGGRLGAGAPVHVSRHRGRLDGLLCLGQRTGFAIAGAIFTPLRAKNATICRPRTEICKKSLDFCKKTLPKSPQMF